MRALSACPIRPRRCAGRAERGARVSRPTIYRRWPDIRWVIAELLTLRIAGVLDAVPDAGAGREPDMLVFVSQNSLENECRSWPEDAGAGRDPDMLVFLILREKLNFLFIPHQLPSNISTTEKGISYTIVLCSH